MVILDQPINNFERIEFEGTVDANQHSLAFLAGCSQDTKKNLLFAESAYIVWQDRYGGSQTFSLGSFLHLSSPRQW
jgi:hypothetical protein